MGTRYAGDDNDSYFDDLFLRIWQSQECSILLGDLNEDGIINILDVILIVNIIIDGNGDFNLNADINLDGAINVLDVILAVNIILNN